MTGAVQERCSDHNDLTALACGPGMGNNGEVIALLETACRLDIPLVLDADALNVLATDASLLALATCHGRRTRFSTGCGRADTSAPGNRTGCGISTSAFAGRRGFDDRDNRH